MQRFALLSRLHFWRAKHSDLQFEAGNVLFMPFTSFPFQVFKKDVPKALDILSDILIRVRPFPPFSTTHRLSMVLLFFVTPALTNL
jgi:hypothetical protein